MSASKSTLPRNIFKPYKDQQEFTIKEIDILNRIDRFFSYNYKYVKLMLPIIKQEDDISIRLLDWFVANYSKKHGTYYVQKMDGQKDIFYVHSMYKNQLKGYNKIYFDPFCRIGGRKIIYKYYYNGTDNHKIITSIGQLNFFQWAIRNKVIDYVSRHIDEIEKDMKKTNKANKQRKVEYTKSLEEAKNKTGSEDDTEEEKNVSSDEEEFTSLSKVVISSSKKQTKSDNTKFKRQQLSKSAYESGVKKTSIPLSINFDTI